MNLQQEIKIFKQGIGELISEADLRARLKEARRKDRPLRIKYGVDPSAPDIHLGHTVPLRKLSQLQDLGHQIIFVIGDFTAQIGDPSGALKKRRWLSEEEVKQNARTYCNQILKILDKKKTEIVFNSRWFSKMCLKDFLRLSSYSTVAQTLARADFKERFDKNIDISITEFFYPLLQGYDSVVLNSDVEIGGTDQKFNLLLGRELQRNYGQKPQIIITLPLLVGTDGICKMSKSFNNTIGINEPAKEIYGKLMSLSDEVATEYLNIFASLLNWKFSFSKINSKQKKTELAKKIVKQYYNEKITDEVAQEFELVFRQKKTPAKIPCFEIPTKKTKQKKIWIVQLLQLTKLASSGGEARRLIKGGAVFIDNHRCKDTDLEISEKEGILKVGRKFCRYKIS